MLLTNEIEKWTFNGSFTAAVDVTASLAAAGGGGR